MQRRLILTVAGALALAPMTAAASGGKPEKKKGGGASFLQIPTLTATIMRADGRRGVMTVETGVDVPDPALRARAEGLLPRLRSAFDEVVRIYAAGLPFATAPNPDFLSRALQRQTDVVLGKPGAKLLLGTVLVN
jgi:hypothetical protein